MKKISLSIAAAIAAAALIGCASGSLQETETPEEQERTDPGPETCQQAVRVDVWADLDGDGQPGPDEPPLEGVLVIVAPQDNPAEGNFQQKTNADGRAYFAGFEFPDCSPDGYSALFARQVSGYAFPDDPVYPLDGFDMLEDVVGFGLLPETDADSAGPPDAASSGPVGLPSRANNPLVGTWREVERVNCATGEQAEPFEPLLEVKFLENGTVSVTGGRLFEAYVDYEARYALNLESGAIEITDVREINALPLQFDGSGTFEIDEAGRLVLDGMWLGTDFEAVGGVIGCGHVLERR